MYIYVCTCARRRYCHTDTWNRKSEIPLENAAENPLGNSNDNPLEKSQSLGKYNQQMK